MFKKTMMDIADEHIRYLKINEIDYSSMYRDITGIGFPYNGRVGLLRKAIIDWYKKNKLIRQAGIVSCEGIGKYWKTKEETE